jgi:hypothetical protein
MSRQYNPAIDAYKNMDIENLPNIKKEEPSDGLLKRKTKNAEFGGLDMNNPAVRAAKQMEVIRKHREEIKNGD